MSSSTGLELESFGIALKSNHSLDRRESMSKMATFSAVWCLKGTSAKRKNEISLYKAPTNKFTVTLKEIISNKINAPLVCPPNVFPFFWEFNEGAKHEKDKELPSPTPYPSGQ